MIQGSQEGRDMSAQISVCVRRESIKGATLTKSDVSLDAVNGSYQLKET